LSKQGVIQETSGAMTSLKSENDNILQAFPPLVKASSRLLILGSMPSVELDQPGPCDRL
jgi:hypothetical protein